MRACVRALAGASKRVGELVCAYVRVCAHDQRSTRKAARLDSLSTCIKSFMDVSSHLWMYQVIYGCIKSFMDVSSHLWMYQVIYGVIYQVFYLYIT